MWLCSSNPHFQTRHTPSRQVLKGKVDFDTDPWPRISAAAKDCVSRLLTMDPAKRTTANEILKVRGRLSQMVFGAI